MSLVSRGRQRINSKGQRKCAGGVEVEEKGEEKRRPRALFSISFSLLRVFFSLSLSLSPLLSLAASCFSVSFFHNQEEYCSGENEKGLVSSRGQGRRPVVEEGGGRQKGEKKKKAALALPLHSQNSLPFALSNRVLSFSLLVQRRLPKNHAPPPGAAAPARRLLAVGARGGQQQQQWGGRPAAAGRCVMEEKTRGDDGGRFGAFVLLVSCSLSRSLAAVLSRSLLLDRARKSALPTRRE